MRIVTRKDVFFEGLQRVSSVVPLKPTLPVLSNFLFRAGDSSLTISGTDMDMSITTSVPCEIEGDGAVTVNAKRFLSIVRELPEGDVTIEVENERVSVLFGGGQASIMGMSADDFPAVRDEIEGTAVTLSGEHFTEMVDRTSFSVATERTRIALTGVYWRVSADEALMVATDGHRLSLLGKKLDIGVEKVAEAVVPPKVLNQASRLVSQDETMNRVVFGDGAILFDFGTTRIFSKLIEGPYPDFRNVIPANNSKRVFVDRVEFEAAVRRVAVVSSTITHQIRLSVAAGGMDISTENTDIGARARERLDVRYDGDSINAGFNSQFLLELLKKIPTDEIVIELEQPTSAALIKPVGMEEQGEYLYLIMPLRLNE